MSAGIIPICSRICGYEDDEVIILDDCSKQSIRKTILDVSKWNIDEIEKGYKKSIELIEQKYNMGEFEKQMKTALSEVL